MSSWSVWTFRSQFHVYSRTTKTRISQVFLGLTRNICTLTLTHYTAESATHWPACFDAQAGLDSFTSMALVICFLCAFLYHIPNYVSRAVRKRVFLHTRIAKAQIKLRIRAAWSGPSLSANRNIGYYRMFQWKVTARMRLCACAG